MHITKETLFEPVVLVLNARGKIKYCNSSEKEYYANIIKNSGLLVFLNNKTHITTIQDKHEISCEKVEVNKSCVYVVIINSIKESLVKYKELAYKDNLTGLYNKNFMQQMIQGNIKLFDSGQYYIIFINIDNLEEIKILLGNVDTESAIHIVADTLLQCIRENDIAVRYEGEIFALIISSLDKKAIDSILSRIKSALKYKCNKENFKISISFGVASFSIQEEFENAVQLSYRHLTEQKKANYIRRTKNLALLKELIESIKALINKLLEQDRDSLNTEIILKISRILDKLLIIYIDKIDKHI